MKLKTLKDLKNHIWYKDGKKVVDGMVDRKELKAEAIKWVKELQRLSKSSYKVIILKDADLYYQNIIGIRDSIMTLKFFFNLTEEDLK